MKRFFRDTRGANMVEYIILVGVVALISIAAFKAYQFQVRGKVAKQATTVHGINDSSGQLT